MPEKEDFEPRVLAAVSALQRSMSSTGSGTVASKAKIDGHQACRALQSLTDQGLLKVSGKSKYGNPEYQCTAEGWDKLGQQPPMWAA